MVASTANDYGEVAPLKWTPRLVGTLSVGVFLVALGLRVVAEPRPEPETGASAAPASSQRGTFGWVAAGLGLVALAGGFVVEHRRQDARR